MLLQFVVAPLVFLTGNPALTSSGGLPIPPMPRTQYVAFAKRYSAEMKGFIAIRTVPAGIGSDVLYGFNFVVDGQNRGWILNGDDKRGWTIYLDMRGNGNLSNARPRRFQLKNGVYRLPLVVRSNNVSVPYRFEIAHFRDENGSNAVGVTIYSQTSRSGTVRVGSHSVPFTLTGSGGVFDEPSDIVAFELQNEQEQYAPSERYVNLFGKSYGLGVDRDGSALKLTPLGRKLPDRPSISAGSVAPEFSARGVGGAMESLAQYRGRYVLMDFWSPYCRPCMKEIPHLVQLHKSQGRRLQLLGVSDSHEGSALDHFLKTQGITWPQIAEPEIGTVHTLYRVNAVPTYYLIGPNGRIVATWTSGGRLGAVVSKYLK